MKICMALAAFAVAAGLAGTQAAFGQSVTFDFQNGTDQGFGTAFGDDASATFPIDNVAGSLRMRITNTTSFQEAGRQAGADGSNFYLAMQAAAANEAGYEISYDYYVDTSSTAGANGTFLQIGTFVNTGSGYYAQHYGSSEVQLDGTQLASGQIFQGNVTQTFAAKGYDMPAADTFFRLGLIVNGDGTNAPIVHFDNISVRPVPEPASVALIGLTTLGLMRRRRSI